MTTTATHTAIPGRTYAINPPVIVCKHCTRQLVAIDGAWQHTAVSPESPEAAHDRLHADV